MTKADDERAKEKRREAREKHAKEVLTPEKVLELQQLACNGAFSTEQH